jgi:uncharacterized protein YjbI with pentapeptide repeats
VTAPVTDNPERVGDNSDEAEVEIDDVDTGARGQVEQEQERHVRLTAQRLLTRHLRQIGNRETFWLGIDLDLDDATLLDFDFSLCEVRDASFDDARFRGATSFVKSRFDKLASFRRARFRGDVKFLGVQGGGAIFNEAHFCKDVEFDTAELEWAEFTRTQFTGFATFCGARLDGRVNFMWANFGRYAGFRGVQFNNLASFDEVKFADTAVFDDARFNSGVGFARATFDESAVFSETEFTIDAGEHPHPSGPLLCVSRGDAVSPAATRLPSR